MSTFQISCLQKPYKPLSFDTDASELPADFLRNGCGLFRSFLQTQNKTHTTLQHYLKRFESHQDNTTPIQPLKSLHKIPLSEEQIITIFKIWAFLRTLTHLNFNEPLRFKIDSLCSITLVKNRSIEEDTLYIHLKKKDSQTILGCGRGSKVTKAIQFNVNGFFLVAEKTLYREEISRFNAKDYGLEESGLFVKSPKALYSYESNTQSLSGKKETIKKFCLIDELYDLSLCELLQIQSNSQFLSKKSQWDIIFFIANVLQALHNKGLVYRDLKPDNLLVKLSEDFPFIDFNFHYLVAADLETVIKEESLDQSWTGSVEYWPKDRVREKQGKSSDIFALSVFIEHILINTLEFTSYPDHIAAKILKLKEEMHDENPKKRPSIDMVIDALVTCCRTVNSTEQNFFDITFCDSIAKTCAIS